MVFLDLCTIHKGAFPALDQDGQAALWEFSSGLSQQSPAVFAWSGSLCAGGSWFPVVLAEATGS